MATQVKPKNNVTIVVEGELLNANRSVLKKASSVFSKLLKDEEISRIEMDDVKEVVEQLLEYINTGQITDSSMQLYATDLLDIANKYRLHSLKKDCQEWLVSKITSESVSFLLDLAISSEAKTLQSKCSKFLSKTVSKE